MPAIDLARLRKQASRLADFFFLPEEFTKHLRETLDFYVNYTLRTKENVAPGSNLKTYRTPPAVLSQIQSELRLLADSNPQAALDLADFLWEEDALEMSLLAAFLLGQISPQTERLLPRLAAWTQQTRDPEVRAALLSSSLTRMRKETPEQFFNLVREYLHPARMRSWSNGIQALLPVIADANDSYLPAILDMVEPVIEEAPAALQLELAELIVALYRASANEAIFLLKNILRNSQNPMTAVTLRRIASSFPPPLEKKLRDLLRPRAIPSAPVEMNRLVEKIFAHEAIESTDAPPKKARKPARKKKTEDFALPQKKTAPLTKD